MRAHTTRLAQLEAEMVALEAQRGTPTEPPALNARLGLLKRTIAWHQRRLDPQHRNTGTASLFSTGGLPRRKKLYGTDKPLEGLPGT